MEIIRLRNYRNYSTDGKSWSEFSVTGKKNVLVAVLLGTEPREITDDSQYLDVDSIILEAAQQIIAARAKA